MGLINVSAQTTTFKNYTLKDGLPSLNIKTITQDSIGYLWFATNKGIARFDGNDFTIFSKKDDLVSDKTNCFAINSNNLLIGTNKGLSIKANNKFQNFEGRNINTIFIHKNDVYLATSEGIYVLKEDYLAPLKINLKIDFSIINNIAFYQNHFWVATNKALWKVDNLQRPKSVLKVENGNFTSLLLHKNKLIATTLNNGIKVLEDKITTKIVASISEINSIKSINNNYWITSTKNGIEILNLDFSFNRKINKYNTFVTDKINFIFEDRQHNIWIASEDKGIYIFPTIIKKTKKPTIHFENIEVAYQPIDSIIQGYTDSGVLQLSSRKNNLSFSYKTVNIANPKSILYQYQLNERTSPWLQKSTVNFANLASGKYTFTVKSKLNNIESNPVQFSFNIDKPLHKKAWFYWALSGFIFLLSGSIILVYIKNIKAKNKAKLKQLKLENHLLSLEQKALQLQMNPHFVFNVLNGIKALGNSNKSEELNTTINKFAVLLRSVLNSSRQEEISLSEEISTLKNYIELEQQMSSNPFEYTIKTDLNIDAEEILIPPMLLQPFVENSIKHGINSVKNGEIDINFSIKDDFLRCSINDNGVGFLQSEKQINTNSHQSLAVNVTKERIEHLSKESKLSIKELIEKNSVAGTRVWFTIPLKTDF